MGRIIVFNLVTADGYFEGKNHDISWPQVDEEVNDYIIEQLKKADTLLFGRKTYQHMENFWPTEEAKKMHPVVAELMNSYKKIVFSKTLKEVNWNNSERINENIKEKVKALKRESTKDILIFGSADLSESLMQKGLIDEFRLMINPVVLGEGKPFFKNIKMDLQLLKVKVFGNGNILCRYIIK